MIQNEYNFQKESLVEKWVEGRGGRGRRGRGGGEGEEGKGKGGDGRGVKGRGGAMEFCTFILVCSFC